MRCSNCGWENPDGSLKCEKCNHPLQGGVVSSPQQGNLSHSTVLDDPIWESPKKPTGTIIEEPINEKLEPSSLITKDPDYTKTINPLGSDYVYTPIPRCILTPVIFPGEDIRDVPQRVNVEGEFTELNRDMLDRRNRTITSKVQATLTFKDGKWYIQNQSDQKTTYVMAEEPIELKSGDVILMGNRTFVFEQEK